jgi:hypothetical protein
MANKGRTPKYSLAMIDALVSRAQPGPLNYFICCELARMDMFRGAGVTARQLSAKVRDLGLPYTPRRELTKNGERILFKQDIVKEIEARLETGDIGSLVKAEKGHLLKLHEQIEVALGDGAVGGQDEAADDTTI